MAYTSRNKSTEKVRGVKATDISYNEQAGAVKVQGPVLGLVTNLGAVPAASTPLPAGVVNGALIALYNTNAATQFVITSSVAIGAAPIATTGICCAPNAYTIIALRDRDAFIRSSSADVIMYLIEDDSFLQ